MFEQKQKHDIKKHKNIKSKKMKNNKKTF